MLASFALFPLGASANPAYFSQKFSQFRKLVKHTSRNLTGHPAKKDKSVSINGEGGEVVMEPLNNGLDGKFVNDPEYRDVTPGQKLEAVKTELEGTQVNPKRDFPDSNSEDGDSESQLDEASSYYEPWLTRSPTKLANRHPKTYLAATLTLAVGAVGIIGILEAVRPEKPVLE